MIRGTIRRWNTRRKLARGRCQFCDRPLRDDAADRFCSDECWQEWQSRAAY